MSSPETRGPLQVARRAQLLEALRHDGVLRVSDLSGRLGAAAVTIRRDIAQLARSTLAHHAHELANPSVVRVARPTYGG